MTRPASPGRRDPPSRRPSPRLAVAVLAESPMVGATLEAMLHGDDRFEVRVGPPGALGRLVDEVDVAVLAASPAIVARTLEASSSSARAVALIAIAQDPRATWTAAARRRGLRAVLRGDVSAEALRTTVAAVAQGLLVLDPEIGEAARGAAARAADGDRGALTSRERQILELLAEGLGNRAVASRLGISRFTVKFHVAAILAKLGAASRTEAVTVGVRRGLIAL